MLNASSKDGHFDISDSTDWLDSPLGSLAPVDAALRCQVCKDFYKTPMITSCCHTFCSLCIRRCLANDGKCPACRALEQENKLRSNWALEGLVDDFLRARPDILAFARRQSSATERFSPKRKLNHIEEDDGMLDQPRKKTRSSNRVSTRSRDISNVVVLDEESDDEEYQPDDGLAACPVCSTRMKVESIDSHLNRCLDEYPHKKSATPASASRPDAFQPGSSVKGKSTEKLERLPYLNYSLFKEIALRKKLQDLGISGQGNRQLLERRHTEWVTLWNANCDASVPKKKFELLHELDVWERTQGGRAPSTNNGLNTGSQLLHKDFDSAAWAVKHDQSFQDLIASARKKVGKTKSDETLGSPARMMISEDTLREGYAVEPGATPVSSSMVAITANRHPPKTPRNDSIDGYKTEKPIKTLIDDHKGETETPPKLAPIQRSPKGYMVEDEGGTISRSELEPSTFISS